MPFSRTMGTPKPLARRRDSGAVNAVESLRRCEQNRLPNDFIFATTAERERTPRLRRPAEGTAMCYADEVALSLFAALRHSTCAPSKSGDGWMSVYWRREILRSPLYGLAISPVAPRSSVRVAKYHFPGRGGIGKCVWNMANRFAVVPALGRKRRWYSDHCRNLILQPRRRM